MATLYSPEELATMRLVTRGGLPAELPDDEALRTKRLVNRRLIPAQSLW